MQALPPDQCVNLLLAQAERLGVEVRWLPAASGGSPEGNYVAQPGRPGLLQLRTAEPTRPTAALCNLVTHEMVHVSSTGEGSCSPCCPWDGRSMGKQQPGVHSHAMKRKPSRPRSSPSGCCGHCSASNRCPDRLTRSIRT